MTDQRSIYRGAQKVEAASIVEWSAGKLQTREYWRPPTPIKHTTFVFGSSGRDRTAFSKCGRKTSVCGRADWRAVERRHRFEPGLLGHPASWWRRYSFYGWHSRRSFDETADASETAKRLGIRHQVLQLSGDTEPNIDELVSAYGEPFACASALGMLRVSKAVRGSATVLLTGDGGDDVFLGYPEHRHLWLAQKLARSLPGFRGEWLARQS